MSTSRQFQPSNRALPASWLLLACLVGLGSANLGAQVVWDNSNGNNRWSTAQNWNPNAVPTSTSNVQFNATDDNATVSDIQLRGNQTANSLTFNNVDDSFSLVNGTGTRTLTLTSGDITRTAGSSGDQGLEFTTLALGGNSVMNIAGSGSFTIAAAITGTATLDKNGAGLFVFSGANTFTGNVSLNAGTLRLSNDGNLGNTANDLSLNGGTLETTADLTLNAGRVVTVAAGGGTLDVNSGTTLTLGTGGQLTGSGALTKADSGTLAIAAGNTGYTGNTVVNGGVLRLAGYDALGTSTTATLTLNNGAELEANWGNGTTNFQSNIVINDGIIRHTDTNGAKAGFQNNSPTSSNLTINGNAQLIDQDGAGTGGFITFDGAVTLNTGANVTANAVNATDEIRFGGGQNITLAAGTTFATTGAGTVSFGSGAARTFIAEGTTASQATLLLGATTTTTANPGTKFQINGSGTGGLRVEGTSAKVDALMTDARLAATTGSGGTLTLAYTNNGSRTLGPAANLSTASAVALGLASAGGTFTLGAAGGGTGDLANWGGLVVGPSTTVTFADNYVFNNTADLTLLGSTLKLNGTTQTFGTLTVSANSIIDFGGGNSVLNLTNLVIATGVTLTVTNWANAADYFYTQGWTGAAFDTSGSAPMNQVVFSGVIGNTHWQSLDKQVTPVPEPSTYGALLLLGAGGLAAWRRRRRA